jgi:hypothetical protein
MHDDLAHGDVAGEKLGARRERLAAVAVWVVDPQPA